MAASQAARLTKSISDTQETSASTAPCEATVCQSKVEKRCHITRRSQLAAAKALPSAAKASSTQRVPSPCPAMRTILSKSGVFMLLAPSDLSILNAHTSRKWRYAQPGIYRETPGLAVKLHRSPVYGQDAKVPNL